MKVIRTFPILIEHSQDLIETLEVIKSIKNDISSVCYNSGKPLSGLALHKVVYETHKTKINSQLLCSTIRLVAGAYASAKKNKHKLTGPFEFKKTSGLFLIGNRGRDASFSLNKTFSISSIFGRLKLNFEIPDCFKSTFDTAVIYNSINLHYINGKLKGWLALSVDVPEPKGLQPVGVDLGEVCPIVATDNNGNTLLIKGGHQRVLKIRHRKLKAQIQRKRDTKKAQKKSTRSTRKLLKRLSGKQRRRNKDTICCNAKKLVMWAPQDCVLVFEDLKFQQQNKKSKQRKGVRRRLTEWAYGETLFRVKNKAELKGISIELVDPSMTSQTCNNCGCVGTRVGRKFSCSSCGYSDHADVNASLNIRDKFTVLRSSGVQSMTPEAQTA